MWKRKPVTLIAAHVPIAFAVWCAARSFAQYGPELFAVLILLFASMTWMLSVSLSNALARFDEGNKRAVCMGVLVLALGLFFLAVDATLTHMGLLWLMAEHPGIFSPAFAWPISIGLALVNTGVKWAYLADSEPPETDADIATSARGDLSDVLKVVGK